MNFQCSKSWVDIFLKNFTSIWYSQLWYLQYTPLCYGLQKKNPKPNWIKSSWFLGKVILRACLFFCHKPTVPLKPSPHKQVPPIQTYLSNGNTKIFQQKYQNILTEIPKYYSNKNSILLQYLKCKYESCSYLILDKEMSIEWSVSDFEHNACLWWNI